MTTLQAPDSELLGLVEGYFSRKFTYEVVAGIEHTGLPLHLWEEIEELGLALIGVDESLGGSGGSLLDLAAVAEGVGRHAVPLPLLETSLAAWLLASAGVDVPAGPLTVVPDTKGLSLHGNRLTGCAEHVPWARSATQVVAVMGNSVVSIDPSRLNIVAGTDLAGMPRDTVTADSVEVSLHSTDVDDNALFMRGALLCAAQIAGAIRTTFELTGSYVQQRVQFGKPIGAFQAVQAHVVELAEVSALTDMCLQRAAIAAIRGPASLEIIAAKSVANRSAGLASRAAHQAHGAIGMTQEYSLQLLTRRLQTWRGDFGDEMTLNLRLGASIAGFRRIAEFATSAGSTTEV